MKKILSIVMVSIVVLTLTGCAKGNSKGETKLVKTCTMTVTDSDYEIESEYKVYGSGKTVDSVVTVETVISDDDDILDYLEEYSDTTYSNMNKTYGGYTFNIDRQDNKLITTTTIDYNTMDMNKFVSDNSAMKKFVNSDNKLLIDGIVSLYKSMGATCK